jgi:dipeptidyl-peptidase-4
MRSYLLTAFLLISGIAAAQKKDITLEDIWRNNTFAVRSVPGFNALKDGEHYTDVQTDGKQRTIQIKSLIDGSKGKILYQGELPVDEYAISDAGDKLLLLTEAQNIYRRSVLHKVYVYEIESRKLTPIDTGKLLHPQFSPDGTKLAFVQDNNLYCLDLKSGEKIPVGKDGMRNKIINGNCDWVYEEEFEFTQAYQWSPDSRFIAWYRFDEGGVPEYSMTMYDKLYPTEYKYKYPKAGEPNSIVEIRIMDLEKRSFIVPNLANSDGTLDYYVPRIKWSQDPAKLCIYKLNRHQNELQLFLADAKTGSMDPIYSETNKAYIEINDDMMFLPDGHSMLFSSERDGWRRLYTWDWKTNRLQTLTPGKFDVAGIVSNDAKVQNVYYLSAEPTPLERRLYALNLSSKKITQLTNETGTHAITGINGGKFFLDRYSSLNNPPVFTLRDDKGRIIRTLEDNSVLRGRMAEYRLGKMEFVKIPVDSGLQLNAWRIVPPDFDPGKKYPVLLYQYSGPGSQEAADRFPVRDYFWHQMLAQKGYVIICADGRGTGFRGEEFCKRTYLQLGRYESDDQIAVAKFMAKQSYVDPSRIGIWGWSYGGFMSSTCMFRGADVFKAGIAVAPVTNWRYYDNVYTERYMRTPAENASGYDDNAPEKMAAALRGKFLLIHGTGDDNVHFQNAAMLVNALIRADKEYDSEFYPNRAHGISGGNTRFHLYRRMTEFILENL